MGPINTGRVGTDLWTIGSDPSQSEPDKATMSESGFGFSKYYLYSLSLNFGLT